MKGFLPSQRYVPVSTLIPVSKVLSFPPPQRSWFPNRIPGKLSHIRRISQGQVFSHSEGSRSRLQKKYIYKIKSRRQTHTPGKNTCDRTLQICIKHAMCFSQWYVPVLCVFFFLFFPSPEVPERNPWNFFTRRSRRGTLETLLLVFFLFVVFRRPSCFNGDPWDRHLTWARPQARKYLGADLHEGDLIHG